MPYATNAPPENLSPLFAGRGRIAQAIRVRGRAPNGERGRSIGLARLSFRLVACLAPHPKPSLRYGFDLSPQRGGGGLGRCVGYKILKIASASIAWGMKPTVKASVRNTGRAMV